MENKRKALGKGLEQLFSNERINFENFDDFEKEIVASTDKKDITEVNVSELRSNPYQPRKTFDETSLQELAESIKEMGIIQPIIVKKSIKGYEIVAGERRTKAARLAGLTKVPVIIKDYNDQEMMEIALLENIQREDLNPIDEANAYKNILTASGMTQDELAKRFGKSRSHITNMLGLLILPKPVLDLVESGSLSMGHARVLSKMDNEDQIIEIATKAVKEKLSVRDIEALSSDASITKRNKITRIPKTNPQTAIYERILREKIGTRVKISEHKIEIPFDSAKDLERILEIIGMDVEADS